MLFALPDNLALRAFIPQVTSTSCAVKHGLAVFAAYSVLDFGFRICRDQYLWWRAVEHILAALAAYSILDFGFRICRDQYLWWRITARWRPRHRSHGRSKEQAFAYQSLGYNAIRLFILEPGPHAEPIRGQLCDASLSSPPPYEALSYVWGNSLCKNNIEINEVSLSAGDNLCEALRHLRRRYQSRVLWVDAICINQVDDEEKSTQVMLMPEIYRKASTVQIWVGPATEHTGPGLQLLSFLAGNQDITADLSLSLRNGGAVSAEVIGLKEILSRSWFERGWVVQEAALSKRATLNIGYQTLSWDEFSAFRFLKRIKFAEITPAWRERIQVDMRSFRELLEIGLRTSNGFATAQELPDLVDLVHETRHRKFTNIRDSIYSVLALAHDGQEFQADYSLSVEETFANLYHYLRIKHRDRWLGDEDLKDTNRITDTWLWLFCDDRSRWDFQ